MRLHELSTQQRFQNARLSLQGLCVGDCFGQRFFAPGGMRLISLRQTPPGPWPYTDDTAMAVSIVRTLRENQRIDQDKLARYFAEDYDISPQRGYGRGAHELLSALAVGEDWRQRASELFAGTGSMGNGGAMRVAPLGAYFADDLDRVVSESARSAEVTHANSEGIAGAIAVAVAAACALRAREAGSTPDFSFTINQIIEHTPDGLTRESLRNAQTLPLDTPLADVVEALGNGSRVLAWDTVPLCIWVALCYLDRYDEALWTCVRAGGDVDTTCAIVGGIVAVFTGEEGIPPGWKLASESLPIGNEE